MTSITPDLIGKYQIRWTLGSGAQGVVYLANDPDLGREVAIKALHPYMAEGRSLGYFVREARMLAQIDHPNIAMVFDVGRDAQTDLYYFAMEFVPHSVEDMLSDMGRLDTTRAASIVQEAASALESARQVGVTHHDVKPGNLLLTSLDDSGSVKLIGFGIAHIVDIDDAEAGAMWGTPFYMAPEQWLSVRGDTRSDVYSLGASLYQLVSGTPPFDPDIENPMARNVEIARMHAEDELPPLDDVDEALWEIIVRCMMKNPADRFQTPGDLSAALERYRAGEPPPAPTIAPVEVPSSVYYTQFVDTANGVTVKASGKVDRAALHAAADVVDRMLRHIPDRLANAGAELAIIPKDEYLTDLPEFARLKGRTSADGKAYDSFQIRGQGAVKEQPVAATSEENLLNLPGDTYSHVEITVGVFAQAIQKLCFTDEDYEALVALYNTANKDSSTLETGVDAFFSTYTTAYFGAIDALPGAPRAATPQILRQFLPEIYAYMDDFYSAEAV